MSDNVCDYYFTITSPWSFLGHDAFVAMARANNVAVNYKPVDFGAVFAVSGGLPLPKRAAQRQRSRLFELQRWRKHRGIDLTLHPKHFPTDPAPGGNAIIAAIDMGADPADFIGNLMRACWIEDLDAADPDVIKAAADKAGLDGGAILSASGSDAVKARADALTEEAKERQVFGAPSYLYRGELWWGQDRLDFVEKALSGENEAISVTFPE